MCQDEKKTERAKLRWGGCQCTWGTSLLLLGGTCRGAQDSPTCELAHTPAHGLVCSGVNKPPLGTRNHVVRCIQHASLAHTRAYTSM